MDRWFLLLGQYIVRWSDSSLMSVFEAGSALVANIRAFSLSSLAARKVQISTALVGLDIPNLTGLTGWYRIAIRWM